jgi:hypothetical protein
MGMLDSARRKMRDLTTTDENISGTPKEKIRELSAALSDLTPQERQRNLEHVKAYTDYYYVGHQRERVPTEIQQAVNSLHKESNRLAVVDQARDVLQKHGGPPTRETLIDSLERSGHQRERESAQYRVEPLVHREMSWKDLHPQQEKAQGQKQENSREHKQEQKQSRSRGQGMEISA